MKVALSHPTGNANVRAAAIALASEGILCNFFTTVACFKGDMLDAISNYSPLAEIKRRQYDSILKPYTIASPWFEAGRMIAPKFGLKKFTDHEKGILSIDGVYKHLDKSVARKLKKNGVYDSVYAYEDGAFYSFKKAADLGLTRFYDLPIGYWRTAKILLDKEKELWPDWADTLTGFSDSEEKLERKDEELRMASKIFVASSFTAKSLENYSGKLAPVEIIPYGYPPVNGNRGYASISKSRPLKILFVGGLSQRKGIANLFSAVEKFKAHVELTIVGRKVTDNCKPLNEALAKHNWIESMPHDEILKLMREQDVFVFPSLFEGFGLVITEAMSQGTPVITTDRTAGPDLINNEENGWLVNAGSTEALQEAIEKILIRPEMVKEAGKAAMDTASKRPWSQYGKELATAVKAYC